MLLSRLSGFSPDGKNEMYALVINRTLAFLEKVFPLPLNIFYQWILRAGLANLGAIPPDFTIEKEAPRPPREKLAAGEPPRLRIASVPAPYFRFAGSPWFRFKYLAKWRFCLYSVGGGEGLSPKNNDISRRKNVF